MVLIEKVPMNKSEMDTIASGEELDIKQFGLPAEPHLPLILKNGSQSLLATITPNFTIKKLPKSQSIGDISPRSAEQHFYLNYLMDDSIKLVHSSGPPGTGKTFLALAAAIHLAVDKFGPQREVIMTKVLSEPGKHRIGTVPGGIREKMEPYIQSYIYALRKIIGKQGSVQLLEAREQIQFMPLNVMKGISIENAIVILDEAQNLNETDLAVIGTRLGENTRFFMLGDITQSDEKCYGSGMTKLMNDIEVIESPFTASIELRKNERSELSDLIHRALNR